jgi:xylan 1,4-beta-xylosidase
VSSDPQTVDQDSTTAARADWEQRIGTASGVADRTADLTLPAPTRLRTIPGRGHVTVDWDPVLGAVGYQVLRSESVDGPYLPVDHHGGDNINVVPHPPYADTTLPPGAAAWYAVAAVATAGDPGVRCASVLAASRAGGPAEVTVWVDTAAALGPVPRPWRPMIGAEHLSYLLSSEISGGRLIGADLAEALWRMREEIGVAAVRSHGILGDDLGVYREFDGRPVHEFSGVDRVYDAVRAIGLRPVVELGFMPRDLASDPTKTLFTYGAVVSPPKDWGRWETLIQDLVQHLVDRYGLAEVRDHWSFEVWNEANLEVFWSGTPEEYFRLYDVTARAVKAVDPALRVGGPASSAAGWVEELLTHLEGSGAPLDFVSTHVYGNAPLDIRPILARHGRADAEIWWTEWGVHPTHFNPVNDSPFSAAFLLRGMRSAAGRVQAVSYWGASDHFEELGRPPRLLHGGFGLQTVGNLRKPRYWALALAERLGDTQLRARIDGDGAESLVEAWAARDCEGTVTVLLWNLTLDQAKADGDPLLDRHVRVSVDALPADRYHVRHLRVDERHSNIAGVWNRISAGADWPDEQQWQDLTAADQLDELEPVTEVSAEQGCIRLSFALPMPGISFLELTPSRLCPTPHPLLR